jgi:hypothetical protein
MDFQSGSYNPETTSSSASESFVAPRTYFTGDPRLAQHSKRIARLFESAPGFVPDETPGSDSTGSPEVTLEGISRQEFEAFKEHVRSDQ